MSQEIELLTNLGHSEQASKAFREIRHRANIELAETLLAMLKAYPDLRFGQALVNFGFVKQHQFTNDLNMVPDNGWVDEYHKEPNELLDRVRHTIDNIFK